MSLFVPPKLLRLGTDLMSKTSVYNPKITSITTAALSNTQNDYLVGNPECDNGTRSNVVLKAKSSVLNLPPNDPTIQHITKILELIDQNPLSKSAAKVIKKLSQNKRIVSK